MFLYCIAVHLPNSHNGGSMVSTTSTLFYPPKKKFVNNVIEEVFALQHFVKTAGSVTH